VIGSPFRIRLLLAVGKGEAWVYMVWVSLFSTVAVYLGVFFALLGGMLWLMDRRAKLQLVVSG
jgi:hypothetical protein